MLYVVATPIGNLEDITYRAVQILKTVDCILAEDTRHSRKLLDHYGIQTPLKAHHEHNEAEMTSWCLHQMEKNKSFALISDAGTPLVSDPGFDLVRQARAKGFEVSPIPGPCAAIAGLSVSGLPTDTFTFGGFLPHKSAAKQTRLKALKALGTTLILYEPPHRLLETLSDIEIVFGSDHPVSLAKELTKQFERFFSGTIDELRAEFEANPKLTQGEFVILIGASKAGSSTIFELSVDQALETLVQSLPKAKSAEIVAKWSGISKRQLYQELID